MTQTRKLLLGMAVMAVLSACSSEQAACEQTADCKPGRVCLDASCQCICNTDRHCEECGSGLVCLGGACMPPPSSSQPPVVESINGTGLTDTVSEHASQHLVDRLLIRGQNLADAKVELAGISPARPASSLVLCKAATYTELEVALPVDIVPGDYSLTVSNAAGSCPANVTLIHGEPGATTCEGCVSAAAVQFNYAGSDSKGGAATDVACSGCISLGSETSGAYDATPDTIADNGVIDDSEVSDAITIDNGLLYAPTTGRVGIGTTTPDATLTVSQEAATSPALAVKAGPYYYARQAVTTGTTTPRCACDGNATAAECPNPYTVVTDQTGTCYDWTSGGQYPFVRELNPAPGNALVIGPEGNVGIGTASPQATLDVNGHITANGNITANGSISVNSISASGSIVGSGGRAAVYECRVGGGVARGAMAVNQTEGDGCLCGSYSCDGRWGFVGYLH